jgi:hypothetical protein
MPYVFTCYVGVDSILHSFCYSFTLSIRRSPHPSSSSPRLKNSLYVCILYITLGLVLKLINTLYFTYTLRFVFISPFVSTTT